MDVNVKRFDSYFILYLILFGLMPSLLVIVGASNVGNVEMSRWATTYFIVNMVAFSLSVVIILLMKNEYVIDVGSWNDLVYSITFGLIAILLGSIIGSIFLTKTYKIYSWGVYGAIPLLSFTLTDQDYIKILKILLNLAVGYGESGVFHIGLPMIAGEDGQYAMAIVSNILFALLHYYVYGSYIATVIAFLSGFFLTITGIVLMEKGYAPQNGICLAHAIWNIMVLL